jgi:hypothetical protein
MKQIKSEGMPKFSLVPGSAEIMPGKIYTKNLMELEPPGTTYCIQGTCSSVPGAGAGQSSGYPPPRLLLLLHLHPVHRQGKARHLTSLTLFFPQNQNS